MVDSNWPPRRAGRQGGETLVIMAGNVEDIGIAVTILRVTDGEDAPQPVLVQAEEFDQYDDILNESKTKFDPDNDTLLCRAKGNGDFDECDFNDEANDGDFIIVIPKVPAAEAE